MALNSRQKQFLKAQAHHLKPVVMLGADGLSQAVIAELETSIDHHELQQCADAVGAELITVVGRVAVLFRQRKEDSRFILPR